MYPDLRIHILLLKLLISQVFNKAMKLSGRAKAGGQATAEEVIARASEACEGMLSHRLWWSEGRYEDTIELFWDSYGTRFENG